MAQIYTLIWAISGANGLTGAVQVLLRAGDGAKALLRARSWRHSGGKRRVQCGRRYGVIWALLRA
jgi:hypothetical protein